MKRRLTRWLTFLCCATFLLALLYLFHQPVLTAAGRWLDIGSPPENVDLVMVLPGDPERRPFVAAALVNTGFAGRVAVIRAVSDPNVEDGVRLPSDQLNRLVLLHRGVPPEKIVVCGGPSGSTFDDARALDSYLDGKPRIRAAIVTNAFHSRRARWTFERVFGRRIVSVVSAPNPGFRWDNWWKSETGFRYVTSEYIKLTVYWLQYGSGCYWGGGFCLGLICVVFWRRWRRRG